MLEFYELAKTIDVFVVFGIIYICGIAFITQGIVTVISWITDKCSARWKKRKAAKNKTKE